jgi:hypothetical protein
VDSPARVSFPSSDLPFDGRAAALVPSAFTTGIHSDALDLDADAD